MGDYRMKQIKVTVSDLGLSIMTAAADYEEIPLSIWLRNIGLKEARASAHRKLCATVKTETYQWCGRPCTKEEFEKFSAESEATNPALRGDYSDKNRSLDL